MNLELSAEQRLLAETARAFVDRHGTDASAVDPWPTMVGAGWSGLLIPEDQGGAGGGMVDVALVCEALGRGPVSSPLIASGVLAALPVLWLGSAEQRERWLPGLAAGATVGTLALLEPGMRDEWDAPRIAGAASLSGMKVLVPWAVGADVMVVVTADGLRLLEVADETVRVDAHDTLDGEPTGLVMFDGATAEPLGGTADAKDVLDRVLDHAAIAELAFAVGAAERALDLSVQHAKDRTQFGRPIGSFQAVAHRCADMRADVDACRYLAYQAAWALDRDPATAVLAVTAAKSYANDAIRRVFLNAHQVHGAIGFSTEHDLHTFTRRAKAFELTHGSTARHRDRLATAMGLGTRR
ncbi:MAG: acyl-CoA dehydrogenase family protein [Acidimicrobiia bacterium]